MSLLKIARIGHPVLFQTAEAVPDPGAPDIRRLVKNMLETMFDAPGVGLAAPQVYESLRLFVYRVPASRGPEIAPSVLINPEIEPVGSEIMLCTEGCLSIPGMRAILPRHARIRYRGFDCDGNLIESEATGFHANVIQHEFDHLNGVLYPMRVTDFTSFGYVEEFTKAGAAP